MTPPRVQLTALQIEQAGQERPEDGAGKLGGCGIDNPLIADMQSLGQPQRLPPPPFLGLGVHLRSRWELWRNRAER